MKIKLFIFQLFLILAVCTVSAAEFTVSSYNCGALSDHYDYLRAASMQKVMQQRYTAEPEMMALNEKIQQTALKILFSKSPETKSTAQKEWEVNGYQSLSEQLATAPTQENSPNAAWFQKVEQTVTSYKVRPVVIQDDEVLTMLNDHLTDLTQGMHLEEAWAKMAKRIFTHHLKFDIFCLQEADYLDRSMFPEQYEVLFSNSDQFITGIAWNKEKLDLIESFGGSIGKTFVVKLMDKESGKTILVATDHLTGCNPYKIEINPSTGLADSAKGDQELKALLDLFEQTEADIKIIGMDSNVTSLHPRLTFLKDAGFELDSENYIESTCSNPNQVLNTRIDWIAIKGKEASIINIPVFGVGLNQIQTNISDHKPIAAKIVF